MFIFLKNRASVFSPSGETWTMVLKRDERDFNKRPEPLQYETSRTFSSLFFFLFQTDYFHSGKNKKKILEPIYLHVLLSKGKELIMNDLSIMFPSAGQGQSQQWGPARRAGPGHRDLTVDHSTVRKSCTADRRSSLFISLSPREWEIGPRRLLTDVQRFDLHAGDSAYQSCARQSFIPLKKKDKSSPSAGLVKHPPPSARKAGKPSHQPPCVGKRSRPIIPLYSKSSPDSGLPRKTLCLWSGEKKIVCEEGSEGIKQVEGKSDLLLDKFAGTHTCMHARSPSKSQTLYNFLVSRSASSALKSTNPHETARQDPNVLSAKQKRCCRSNGATNKASS